MSKRAGGARGDIIVPEVYGFVAENCAENVLGVRIVPFFPMPKLRAMSPDRPNHPSPASIALPRARCGPPGRRARRPSLQRAHVRPDLRAPAA